MYSMTTHVRWRDLDSNAHMANSAYLDIAVDCRLRYFADSGFSVGEFARLGFDQSSGVTKSTTHMSWACLRSLG